MDSIVYYNFDQYKHKNYATNLFDNSFKNNLNAAIVSTGIKEDHINSGCLYSNIDNRGQNFSL